MVEKLRQDKTRQDKTLTLPYLSWRVWFQAVDRRWLKGPHEGDLSSYISSKRSENSGVLASNTGARSMLYGLCNSGFSWILLHCTSKCPNRTWSGCVRRCPVPLSPRLNMFCDLVYKKTFYYHGNICSAIIVHWYIFSVCPMDYVRQLQSPNT